METLLTRLAAPLQAFGAEHRIKVVTTNLTPTRSALLGICRAALGHGRDDDPGDVAWLDKLRFAVRVDRRGERLVDLHNVNPRKSPDGKLFHTPLTFSGKHFGDPSTLQTWRHYLTDASFLWLTSGEDDALRRLRDAFASPIWQRAAGRKSCVLDAPFLLGLYSGGVLDAAHAVPVVTPSLRAQDDGDDLPGEDDVEDPTGADALEWVTALADGAATSSTETQPQDAEKGKVQYRPCDLVFLDGAVPDGIVIDRRERVLDRPLGPHPRDGYAPGYHSFSTVSAPAVDGLGKLLCWASEHLHD